MRIGYLACMVVAAMAVACFGCKGNNQTAGQAPPGQVIIYTSVDDQYVRPLVQRFERETGIKVMLQTDAEASKTAGLATRIEGEKDNPRADVYWGNEIFHTINLAEKGIFTPYRSELTKDIPARWRDRNDLYVSIGLRVRVLVVSARPENRQLVGKIKGLRDLADPALKGKVGICNPAFGTASGHVAALYLVLGREKFGELMRGLRANDIRLLGGNSVVVDQIAAGTLVAGPTDTDDVANAKAENQQVDGVLPDQDSFGTLLIPTTIALVKGGPNSENGKRLINFLLAPDVEKELIDGRYLAYSVRDAEKQVKAMDVNYVEAAHQMRTAVESALNILQGRSGNP
ncbi:MAG: extracellular solute-binding protein [Planctomycetes bacterium]|nr:extracellular solute-binding protein [Planctomycetota bacterium]